MMAITIATTAHADSREVHFEAGLTAYDDGDYRKAVDAWQKAVDLGDIAAARNLGHLYRRGLGVTQD